MGTTTITATTDHSRHATASLMEAVVEPSNMQRAYQRVMRNKGAPGIDRMAVEDLAEHIRTNWAIIRKQLLAGAYQPQPVRKVEIPKPNGGMRMLGIPTVVDRLIQQAIQQVLTPLFEPQFSDSSFGFRPKRSTHDAVKAARSYAADGYRWVVDMDLEKFFDRVNHDILMARLARTVKDKVLLGLIRRYLQAGVMEDGLASPRVEGVPQGGPLSPLMSNVLLTDLDRELERRGHRFSRYADDCNIYVRSAQAGKRVLASITRFLSEHLRLRVNVEKSAVDRPWKRKFLGYTMTWHKRPRLKVAKQSMQRLMDKVREVCRRGRGWSLQSVISELTPVLRGWANYYRLAEVKGGLEALDIWVRRKLRGIIWRQWKKPGTRRKELIKRGLPEHQAWKSASNGRGPWWNAGAPHMHRAFPNRAFDCMGLVSLLEQVRKMQAVA
jgi:RNA-directed DNA polymerase